MYEKQPETMASQPPQPSSSPDLFWEPEELVRKAEILSTSGVSLTEGAQRAVRCAECLMQKKDQAGEIPNFTKKEISRCQDIPKQSVRHTVSQLLNAELITEEEAPHTSLYGHIAPYVYRPVQKEGDEPFFRPAAMPGCQRTVGQNIAEDIKPALRQVLKGIDELKSQDSVDQSQLVSLTGLNRSTISPIFKTLCEAEVLIRCEGERPLRAFAPYSLTQRGLQLLELLRDVPDEASLPLLVRPRPASQQEIREFHLAMFPEEPPDTPAVSEPLSPEIVIEELSLAPDEDEKSTPEPESPEDLRRKEVLSKYGLRLTPAIKEMFRCAGCILARDVVPGDEHYFTASEIATCRGIALQGVRKALRKQVEAGLILQEDAPHTVLYGGGVAPAVYRPATEEGDELFTPKPNAECQRTTGQNILEGLRSHLRKALDCLAKPSLEGPLNQRKLAAETGLADQDIERVFRTLCKTEILAMADETGLNPREAPYDLTERGMHLLEQTHPAERASFRERAALEQESSLPEINPALLQKIQELYPPKDHQKMRGRILDHIELGVLQGGTMKKGNRASDVDDGYPALEFTPEVHNNIGSTGELSIALLLGLYPVLYPNQRPPSAADMRRKLQLPEGAELGRFIGTRYYRPLLERLAKPDLPEE